MSFRYGGLFSGVGGLEIAAEMCGGEPVFMCEQDLFCQRILRRRFPGVPIIDDVREITNAKVAEIVGRQKNLLECAIRASLYRDGLSLEEIANARGVSRQAVWEMLVRSGVDLRPQERFGSANNFYRGGSKGSDWAHNQVEHALERGDLVRPIHCEQCGGDGVRYSDGRAQIQAHHDDYNKPLKVRWLCQICHHRWHETHTAIICNEGVMPTGAEPLIDVLVGGFP